MALATNAAMMSHPDDPAIISDSLDEAKPAGVYGFRALGWWCLYSGNHKALRSLPKIHQRSVAGSPTNWSVW